MKKAATAAILLLLSFLSWAVFPGHTWLQQDSQIYTPILEHLRDPSVLKNDLIVEHPHVSFTVYDESALALRAITGLDFHAVLMTEQILFRSLGLWGVYLLATSLGLNMASALVVTLLWSLGAAVNGPAVLTVEYEPVPRAFAVPLLMLAIGLAAHGRWVWSGFACAGAILMHPPAVWPVLLVYPWLKASRIALVPVALGTAALVLFSRAQVGATEAQSFLNLLDPQLEMLQRMRAPYNWLDLWWREYLPQYLFLTALCAAACWRLWSRVTPGLQVCCAVLPAAGLLSMPVSFLLLNVWKWALIPQLQPMRALLFITVMAIVLAASAGCVAGSSRRYLESFAWFAVPCLLPMQTRLFDNPSLRQWAVWLGLAAACALVCGKLWRLPVLSFAYWAFAAVVTLYPHLHSRELDSLSSWARTSTPRDAVFFFGDNGKQNYPGVFRSQALRAVYADWKGGGQVNYLPAFARQWWLRWQASQSAEADLSTQPGIDYLVVSAHHELRNKTIVFVNASYRVYKLR